MSAEIHDELDRLLGVEKPQTDIPASDPRFANALAEKHGVTSIVPVEHMNNATAELARVLARVKLAPVEKQIPALLKGVADLIKSARLEGPAIVQHLEQELRAGAVDLLGEIMKGQPQ